MADAACVQVPWEAMGGTHGAPRGRGTAESNTVLLVGDVVGQRGAVLCPVRSTLLDAADVLILHDRTAVGIVDEHGELKGAITENDVLRAYATGAPPETSIGTWLDSGCARAPRQWMSLLTVLPSTSLKEAAVQMLDSRATGESACHHLVVKDDKGAFCGILSSLDLARAMCRNDGEQELIRKFANTRVADVMKPESVSAPLPCSGTTTIRCSSTATLAQALAHMAASHQNCVLVTDAADSSVMLGVVTPRDALRGFTEHVRLHIEVGGWLRSVHSNWEPRKVQADAPLAEAAARMVASSIHHLVVVSPATSGIVGVVSSLDLAQAMVSE